MDDRDRHEFPSTCWNEIAAAGSLSHPEGRAALGRLVQRYQAALVAFIRKKFCGGNEDSARELFQRFVAEIVVTKGLIGQARPVLGHQFRSFLLRALQNFIVSDFRREFADKRHPSGGLDSLEARADQGQTLTCETQAANFDLEWARGIIAKAVGEMQRECNTAELPHIWNVFESRLLNPLLNGNAEVSYDELVKRFNFSSPAQAHNALVTAKRKFAQCLRRVIGEYVVEQGSVEMELRELLLILEHNS